MAGNPFDQFDDAATSAPASASSNPFDQFDDHTATSAPDQPVEDTGAMLEKMLADPKVRYSDLAKFYSDRNFHLTEAQAKVLQDRDTFNDANPGQVAQIGVVPGDPEQTIAGPVDNRAYSFREGVSQGVQHVASNVAGAAGFIGNHIGLDNNWGDDARGYFERLEAAQPVQGSAAGRIAGELATVAPSALIAAPVEAGAGALGAGGLVARALGMAADGGLQAGLTSNSRTLGGVVKDVATGS